MGLLAPTVHKGMAVCITQARAPGHLGRVAPQEITYVWDYSCQRTTTSHRAVGLTHAHGPVCTKRAQGHGRSQRAGKRPWAPWHSAHHLPHVDDQPDTLIAVFRRLSSARDARRPSWISGRASPALPRPRCCSTSWRRSSAMRLAGGLRTWTTRYATCWRYSSSLLCTRRRLSCDATTCTAYK